MDSPPACHFASVQDGKQEIYLEWPKHKYNIWYLAYVAFTLKIPLSFDAGSYGALLLLASFK